MVNLSIGLLKQMLFKKIQKLENEEQNLFYLKDKISILKSIIYDLEQTTNYEELYDITRNLTLALSVVYDKNKTDKIGFKLEILILRLKTLKGKDEEQQNKLKVELSNILKELKFDLKEFELSYVQNKDLGYKDQIKSYRTILSNFKYKKIITKENLDVIDKFLQEENIDEKNQVRILEYIKNHNLDILYKEKNIKSSYFNRRIVLDMLDLGFEEIPDIYIDNDESRKRCNAIIDVTSNILLNEEDVDMSYILSSLPDLTSYEYSYEEFTYIINSILKKLQEEIYFYTSSIATREYYDNLDGRTIMKDSFINLRNRYCILRDYYYNKIEIYEEKLLEQKDEEIKNNLFYLSSDSNSETTYIEKDLKKIQPEYLYKVDLLLKKLKFDMLSIEERKGLHGNKKISSLKELKDDQIRILFYHLDNNNYMIIGCAVKKSDNLMHMYTSMADRIKNIDFNNVEILKEQMKDFKVIEERMEQFITSHKRKGTR